MWRLQTASYTNENSEPWREPPKNEMGGKNNQVGEIGKVGPIRKKDLRVVERGKTDPLANKSTPKKWIGNKNG